ncbi:hypothetical protein Pint_34584 [Pistacia integerrima]|uniref:Uncharacterized protein n=1 Tax=Pistacia integerrima TaxID=434235 RepID=A0ACC0X5E0_9ROSI|nr:hypothetical protein Pint_34584 [Pistacia integerrima]
MELPREVGLGLLLSPISSNIVMRTACCGVGTVLPAYSTFKAIENDNRDEQRRWLLYWTVYGSFRAAEVFADKILYWFPLYYHVKFAFLVWLQLPPGNSNFVSAHQPEFQFVGAVFMEIMSLVNQTFKDVIHPMPRQGNHAIEGPTAQIPDPHPDQGTERLTAQIPDPQPNDED